MFYQAHSCLKSLTTPLLRPTVLAVVLLKKNNKIEVFHFDRSDYFRGESVLSNAASAGKERVGLRVS